MRTTGSAMCQNCGTSQGPFRRIVLPLTSATIRLPAKSQITIVTCREAADCNKRRAKKENS